MQTNEFLICINPRCRSVYPLSEVRYECARCGDLLEVTRDFIKLSRRSGKYWRDLFDDRLKIKSFPWNSGVWRYKEFILAAIPVRKIVSLGEGNTNLIHSPRLSKLWRCDHLYFKLEGENPTLSFKDRGMTAGVSFANSLPRIRAVACASTGDTSAAMAAYAAHAQRLQGIVFIPHNKISYEQLSQPMASGAVTLALDTDFDGCMKLVVPFCKSHGIYLLNSMNSIRIEGQKAIAFEILQQLNWKGPDWIILPVGNAGNISAVGKGLLELKKLGMISHLPRLAGIQIKQAAPLYHSFKNQFAPLKPVQAGKTVASAIRIGNPVSFKKAVSVLKALQGVVEQVSEQEVMDSKAIVEAAGISICPNSATAVAGFVRLLKRGLIKKKNRVVIISTAHALKFSQTTLAYHQGKLLDVRPKYKNPPIPCVATLSAIRKALGW